MSIQINLPYTISGTVRHGKQLGRTLGFPTINLLWDESVSLPFGVYISKVTTPFGEFMGMTNIGKHPTLPDGGLTAETYLLDTQLDLYDSFVSVELFCFTRPETRFDSVEALKSQLSKDLDETRRYFNSHM